MNKFSKKRRNKVIVLLVSVFIFGCIFGFWFVCYNCIHPPCSTCLICPGAKSKKIYLRQQQLVREGRLPSYGEYRLMTDTQKDSVLHLRDSILRAEGLIK